MRRESGKRKKSIENRGWKEWGYGETKKGRGGEREKEWDLPIASWAANNKVKELTLLWSSSPDSKACWRIGYKSIGPKQNKHEIRK